MSKELKPESEKNPAAVALGKLGGKAGRDASKRRTREHYQRAAAIRWAKVRAQEKIVSPS